MKTTANLFLVTLLLFAVSCNKQAIDTPEPDVSQTIHASAKSIKIKISLLRFYHDDGDYYGCDGIGGNCLPDVVIICNALQQTIHAVDNAPDDIITIFENNRQEMTDVLESEDAVNGVINGEIKLSIKGAATDKYRYLLLKDRNDDELLEVVPIKLY